MEPAPYPPRNTEELQAVITFLSLLDVNRVKPDPSFLDRVPNHDGSVELVDEQQKPVGELKIQIKKIPDGSLQFDCPIQLVGYSIQVSSPFLLVCVDVGNRKAYWRHLSSLMAGLKSEQKTFTVKFQAVVDEISPGAPYLERWRMLCNDYLTRVSEYPRLKQIVDEEIGLNKLTAEDRLAFQEFIDEMNLLLDVDLPVVKHEYFADAWKLGVSIHQADSEAVCYSVYTIPKGENAPFLTHVPRAVDRPTFVPGSGSIVSWHVEGGAGAEVSIQWAARSQFQNPSVTARAFVFRYLIRLIRNKRLHVHGRHQSVELLMWFLRDYAHTLGLPEADTYKTSDIAYGLGVYLPMWYTMAYPRTMEYFRNNFPDMLRCNPRPSFEQIANTARQSEQPTESEIRGAIASRRRAAPTPVRTDSFSVQSLWQAVEFLMAANTEDISRSDRPWSKAGTWIGDCFTQQDLQHNVVAMLTGAVEDYADFVKGNRFGRLDSPLISREAALVCAADFREWQNSRLGPWVDGYWVENADRSLPLMTFIDLSKEPDGLRREGNTVTLRGVRRRWTSSWDPVSRCFHEQRRTQAALYDLLKVDLERRFGERFD